MAPYRWSLIGSVLCSAVLAGCSFFFVWLSKSLIDTATGHAQGSLVVLGAAFGGVILLRIGTRSLRSWLLAHCSLKMKNAMRQRLFDSILQMTATARGQMHSGDIVNRLEGDVGAASSAFSGTLPNLVGTIFQLGVALVYLLILDARLAWLMIVIVPAGLFAARYVMHKLRTMTSDIRKNDSLVQSHIQESVQHQSLIKTMEYDNQSSSSLTELQSNLYQKTMRRTAFSIAANVISSLCFSGSYALAFLWSVHGIAAGTITYGLMTAFLQLVNQIQRPLAEMGDQLPTLFHCTASIDRLLELEQMEKEELCDPVLLNGTCGIKVEDLSFRYEPEEKAIFEHFNHDFKPGSKTALIGTTGVGKTTLIKLILALLKPEAGSIRFYSDLSAPVTASPATRCNLVYVPQGNSLLSGTVRGNLLMGDPDADEERMKEALYTAAADFVLDNPLGLDSECTEQGGGLSEGQAQRIAIARGLLRPGSIFLLDEFSSALDPDTEKLLLERLSTRRPDATIIFITHREQIAQYCDSVLKL